jgi:arylformamidase
MSRKVIDLTMPCSDATEGVSVRLQDNLPVYLGQECYAYDLEIKSHTGTYFETSAHVFRDGETTDAVAPDRLVLPGVCLRIISSERCVTAADLEMACKPLTLQPNSALLIDTGKFNSENYIYFSRDAAQWMTHHKVALMGSNSYRYDSGFENPTGFFIDLFEADIPIIANITNLDLLPNTGFILIVLPLRISGICTVPCRVVAVCGAL